MKSCPHCEQHKEDVWTNLQIFLNRNPGYYKKWYRNKMKKLRRNKEAFELYKKKKRIIDANFRKNHPDYYKKYR